MPNNKQIILLFSIYKHKEELIQAGLKIFFLHTSTLHFSSTSKTHRGSLDVGNMKHPTRILLILYVKMYTNYAVKNLFYSKLKLFHLHILRMCSYTEYHDLNIHTSKYFTIIKP